LIRYIIPSVGNSLKLERRCQHCGRFITVPKIVGEFFKARPNQWLSNHFSQITYAIYASQILRQVTMT